jgi:hypothetical protein
MINDIVNKVYVITTLNSDRVKYISTHLKNNDINFEFFVSPLYNLFRNTAVHDLESNECRPSLSLISAYTSIFEMGIINDYDSIGIIEDDCFFLDGWESKFELFIKNIPEKNWDILHVGYHMLHETDSVLKNINKYVNIPINWHHTTHCMLVKKNMYKKYIDIVFDKQFTYPVDYVFNEIYKEKKYNCFSPVDKIAYQLSSRNNKNEDPHVKVAFKSFV